MDATVGRVNLDPRQGTANVAMTLEDGTFVSVSQMPFQPSDGMAYNETDSAAVVAAVRLLNQISAK